jgi:EAL domain-containing protein (putative c-di-GMP-specific phosphodiesterase class I)
LSLNDLKNFPIDILKINRPFIRQLAVDGGQGKSLDAILKLGDKMGIDVVAVGIETEEQLNQLKIMHFRKGQGYYFARPLEEKSLRSLLSSHIGE